MNIKLFLLFPSFIIYMFSLTIINFEPYHKKVDLQF